MSEINAPGEASVVPTPRVLPHIPLEVLQQIASHIDIESARNLSRTCMALRDCGECKIWQTVDVTSGWDPEAPGSVDVFHVSSGLARAAVVDLKLRHVLNGFESYPFRLECVEVLRLEPSDGTGDYPRSERLLEVLELVANRIKRLDIAPLPVEGMWAGHPSPDSLHHNFSRDLNEANLAFPNLTHLKYAHTNSDCEPLDWWMSRMEKLQEIEYSYSIDSYAAPPSKTITREPLQNLGRITYSYLHDVEAEEDDSSQPVLVALLDLAPNLEFLRMSGEWRPRKSSKLLQSISKLEKLKTIVLKQGDESGSTSLGGLDLEGGMEFRRLGKAEMRFEEAATEHLGWDEMNELNVDLFRFPRAANLRRYTVLTTPRLPLSDYVSLGIGPTPATTGHLSPYFFHYISHVPILSTILFLFLEESFPSTHNANYVEPEYFVDPSRWEEEGHRGAIIRHYSTKGEWKEELWHIRALSRSLEHKSGLPFVGARRYWQDFTHFKGRTVPRNVLEEAYVKAGLEVASVEGGRDMDLGDGTEAWEVLREWRDTAGDESEIDDEFSDEDIEGSEEDSDEDDDLSEGGGWNAAQILADNAGDDGDGWVDTDDDGEYESDSDDPLAMF